MDAVEESNHRCDGPHLQFMTHLQHVLIEPEATPMRLMPCVPPTQTGLPLPSTRLQVFSAHGLRWRRRRRPRKLICARHRRQATVLSASLRSPRGARHRADVGAHVRCRRRLHRRPAICSSTRSGAGGGDGAEAAATKAAEETKTAARATATTTRSSRRQKGNHRIATARSGSAAYAFATAYASSMT